MKVKIKEEGSAVIVSVDSSVLQEHIPIFRERLNDIIAQEKCWIVIDLFEANYISSIGISVLLEVRKKAEDGGGAVVFANVNHLIMNLFKMTELIKTLEIYETNEQAIEALNQKMA